MVGKFAGVNCRKQPESDVPRRYGPTVWTFESGPGDVEQMKFVGNWFRSVVRRFTYTVEVSPVVDGVIMLGAQPWAGTATQMLNALSRIVPRAMLPSTASHLSQELRQWSEVMLACGVRVSFTRVGHESRRVIRLEPVAGK